MWTSSSPRAEVALPGAYLLRTRIGGTIALLSYAWLEFAPLAAAAASVSFRAALGAVLAHWAFLGIYELGYLYNDRANTAAENSDDLRPRVTLATSGAAVFAAIRFAFVGAVAVWLHSPAFAMLSVAVLLLLVVHTRVGETWPGADPRRIITFAWLAACKYLPAAATFLDTDGALRLCALLFVAYGGGRVLFYALSKAGTVPRPGTLDPIAAWSFASLPAAVVVATGDGGRLAALAVIMAHQLAATAAKAMRGPAR